MNESWVGEFLSNEASTRGKAVCSSCGSTLPDSYLRMKSSDRICGRCSGRPGLLDQMCPECGSTNSIRSKACHSCGENFHKGGKGGGTITAAHLQKGHEITNQFHRGEISTGEYNQKMKSLAAQAGTTKPLLAQAIYHDKLNREGQTSIGEPSKGG